MNTGPHASESEHSGFFKSCQKRKVLSGTASPDLKPKAIKALHWQYDQMGMCQLLQKLTGV